MDLKKLVIKITYILLGSLTLELGKYYYYKYHKSNKQIIQDKIKSSKSHNNKFLEYSNYLKKNFSDDKSQNNENIFSLMKNSPLIRLNYISKLTGLEVFAKCEHLLPFTSKDRMMKNIFFNGILQGKINENSVIYEGSSGSTCYSAAMISNLFGLKCKLVIPDDLSDEKLNLLKTTNAELIITKQCPYSNFNENYVRMAKKLANEDENGFFIGQFENENNWKIHYEETAPEIIKDLKKINKKPDYFFSGAGTGGTICGISNYFKEKFETKIILSDVNGSGLHSWVKNKVLFTNEETEKNRKRYRYYTNIEGIGINFLSENFKKAIIDDSVKIEDQDAIKIAKEVYINDGLFVGGSTGVNFSAILNYSKNIPKGSTVVTIIYDSGLKYINKLYS